MKIFLALAIYFSYTGALASDCKFPRSIYLTGKNHFQQGQYLLGASHFSLIKDYPCNQQLMDKASLAYLYSIWKLEDTVERDRQLDMMANKIKTPELQQKLYLFGTFIGKNWDNHLTNENKEKVAIWENRFNESFHHNNPSLKDFSHQYKTLDLKSPALAGSLSIIPGLGQVYNGTFEAAGIAFVLNAVLGAATYEFFDKDQTAAGIASGLVFSVTYLGNIISAANGASQINQAKLRVLEENYQKQVFDFRP